MSHATVVRYTTNPEHTDENERLIRDVFAALAEQPPDGLRYVVIRLDDGVSFVHVAIMDEGTNVLVDLPAFQTFVAGIGNRVVEGPSPVDGTLIASCGLDQPPRA
jgi:hypothetical protein